MSIDFDYVLLFWFAAVILFNAKLNSQWANDPAYNKKLALGAVNPTNISISPGENGGAFITWSDKKNEKFTGSFIQFINADGNAGFRADGKILSSLESDNLNPILSNQYEGSVVACWLEQYGETKTALKVQRIKQNGFFLWDENGLQVTDGGNEIKEYKITTDDFGTSYILFSEKDAATKKYFLKLQKISPSGYIEYSYKGLTLASSDGRISSLNIFHSAKNGNYIFWNDEKTEKTISYFAFLPVDESSSESISRKKIFEMNSNLISKQIFSFASNKFFVLIQDRGKSKKFFSFKIEKNVSAKEDFIAEFLNSKQNPFSINFYAVNGEKFFLTWIEEKEKSKNIFIKLFHLSGAEVWNQDLQLFRTNEEQVSYSAFTSGNGELKISWVQKPVKRFGKIFSQIVSASGEFIFSNPVPTAIYEGSEKSYLRNYSDLNNGSIVLFREKRGGESSIYGQRIYSPGKLSIADFRCVQNGNEININFKNLYVDESYSFTIHRGSLEYNSDTTWIAIKSFAIVPGAKNFSFQDSPDSSGVYFYKVEQSDEKKQIIYSSTAVVNYFLADANSFEVFENAPNPFFGQTTISFFIPEPSDVKLIIYNAKLETIIDTTLAFPTKGKKNYVFSGYGYAPGVYYYRIIAGNKVEVKKMVMVK